MIITTAAELIIKETADQAFGWVPKPRMRGRSRSTAPFTSTFYAERGGGSVQNRLTAAPTSTIGANGQRGSLPR